MKKTTYIAPSTSLHVLNLQRNILLSASGNGNGLLGNGVGTTGTAGVSSADTREDNAWDIWGTGEYED